MAHLRALLLTISYPMATEGYEKASIPTTIAAGVCVYYAIRLTLFVALFLH